VYGDVYGPAKAAPLQLSAAVALDSLEQFGEWLRACDATN
jgi:hypothetical protein